MTRRFLWLAVPALALTGCDMFAGEEEPAPEVTPSVAVSETPTPPDTPTPETPVAGERQVSEETDDFLFEYSYPQVAGEEAGLAAWLDRRMDRERSALAREASRGRQDARDNGFPFNKYSSETTWEVVADLPGYLSLSALQDTYYGGAHPNYEFDSVVWDRGNGRTRAALDFFKSGAALDEALGDRLCDALNAERAERRGMAIDSASGGSFESCVGVAEATVLLGSSNGRTFNRVGVQMAPYVAGPYAEGSYEFTFRVDEALLAAVKPEYRAAFAVMN